MSVDMPMELVQIPVPAEVTDQFVALAEAQPDFYLGYCREFVARGEIYYVDTRYDAELAAMGLELPPKSEQMFARFDVDQPS